MIRPRGPRLEIFRKDKNGELICENGPGFQRIFNLHSEQGNVFYLLNVAQRLGEQSYMTPFETKRMREDIMGGDYKHVIETFD